MKRKWSGLEEFINFYGKNILDESTLINGVENFLKWCKEKKISMAVCTNKQEHLSIDLLKKIKKIQNHKKRLKKKLKKKHQKKPRQKRKKLLMMY